MKRFLDNKIAVAFALFLLAALPRFIGLTWALPNATHWFSYHPDERQIVEAVANLNLFGGNWNPHFFNYPSLYIYFVWLDYWLNGIMGVTTPAVGDAPWPVVHDIVFCGRFISALLGALTIPVLYLWLRPLHKNGAILAAILCAFAPGLVQHSHFATVDVAATFWVVLCLWLTRRGQTMHRKYLLWAALCAGLGAATKYNAILVIIAPLFVILTAQGSRDYVPKIIGLSVLGFVLGCPYSVLSFSEFWGTNDPNLQQGVAFELLTHPKIGSGEIFQQTGNGWIYHLTFTLPFALGAPLYLWALFGIGALSQFEVRKYLQPALVFAAIYFLAIGTSQVRFLRYVLPMVPVLCACAIIPLALQLPTKKTLQVLAACVLAFTAIGAFNVLYPFVRPDARDVALDWLQSQNAPELQTVALADQLWFGSPPLLPTNAPMRDLTLPATTPDGKFQVSKLAMDWEDLDVQSPRWLSLNEFDWRDKARLNDAEYAQWERVLARDYELAWQEKVQSPLSLPGRAFVPHDFLYPNPELRWYRHR